MMTNEIYFFRKIICPMLVALTFIFSCRSFAVGQDECRSDVVECFEAHRKAVALKSPNLAIFFSKEVNEEWLKSLSKNRSSEDQLAVLGAVKSKASFSRRICTINHYEHVRVINGTDLLKVFYTTSDGKGPYLYEISFINQMGFLYISSTLSDTTVDAKKYSSVVLADFCKAREKSKGQPP